jgi:stalled ribosome rescue protein Dom34
MTSDLHAAVWLDQQEARIFHVDGEGFDEAKILSPHRHVHRHPKGAGEARENPEDAHRFFREVAQTLAGAGEILVVGPSAAKLHFLRYLHTHDRTLEAKIVGLETVDHPTDRQLVAYVKQYFGTPDARIR